MIDHFKSIRMPNPLLLLTINLMPVFSDPGYSRAHVFFVASTNAFGTAIA